MQAKNALVLVVDRFGSGYLGPYGNTWIETPALNRLASESFLCEHALADSSSLQRVYRSYWQGLHAMFPDSAAHGLPSLAELLRGREVNTLLLSDERIVLEHELAASFDQQKKVSLADPARAAEQIEQTQLAQLFACAIDWLAEAPEPFLLWVHARAMNGPWDAPLALRNQMAAEDDPTPPDLVDPPSLVLGEDYDPDQLLGMVQAYAGQVWMLDTCIAVLCDALAAGPSARDTLLLLTSPRGYPLGEHRGVGSAGDALQGELLNVPWMMRFPEGMGAMQRTQTLVQPADLFTSLLDWYGIETKLAPANSTSLLPLVRGQQTMLRELACAIAGGERAIRTPAWFLRQQNVVLTADESPQENSPGSKLFAKPDDRWELNEVSVRCPEVISQLRIALGQFHQAAETGDFSQLTPLPEVLLAGLD